MILEIGSGPERSREGGQTAQNEPDAAPVQTQAAAKRARDVATKAQDAAKVRPREPRRVLWGYQEGAKIAQEDGQEAPGSDPYGQRAQ